MDIAIVLVGLLAYFTFIFWYAKEPYIIIFSQYMCAIIVVLMSYFLWQYSLIQNYVSLAGVFEKFFYVMIFTFSMFNFYLFMKFLGWIYRVVAERYIR